MSLGGLGGCCGALGVVAVRGFCGSDVWGGPVGGVSWQVDGS